MTTTNTTQRGYGYAWQKLRKRALWRDKGLCQSCLKQGRTREAKDVDHIKRKADGGEDHLDNLQSLCSECHEAKTRDENSGRVTGCDMHGVPLASNHHWNANRQKDDGRGSESLSTQRS